MLRFNVVFGPHERTNPCHPRGAEGGRSRGGHPFGVNATAEPAVPMTTAVPAPQSSSASAPRGRTPERTSTARYRPMPTSMTTRDARPPGANQSS